MIEDKPRCWFVCRSLGRPSEPWLWRQVVGLKRLAPTLICWGYDNPESYPLKGIPVECLDFPASPLYGSAKWLIRLRNISSGNFYASIGRERKALNALIRKSRPDVLLCQFGHYALRLLPVAEEAGVPLIAHFHGLDISSSLLQDRWYRWSLEKMIDRFTAVVCVGTEQKRRLIGLGVAADNVHLIPCGVPTDDFAFSQRTETGEITFVCVGRLVEWKGVHHTIAAYAVAASQIPESRLVIVGDGPEMSALKTRAKDLGVADRVEFVGSQDSAQVRQILQVSDVFLQHSLDHSSGWFEGFGVSVAEASAIGLPLVVAACGGITDQVLDGITGIVVPQRDEAAMAEGMVRLACDPGLRQRMGRAGRERMVQHYDTKLQVTKLEQVLLDAVEHHRRLRQS